MPGRLGNSSILWGGSVSIHPGQEPEDERAQKLSENCLPPVFNFLCFAIRLLWSNDGRLWKGIC